MARNLDRVGGVAQAAANAGVLINRKNIRFLDGGGITWTATDDPLNDEVEVAAAVGGGSGVPTGTIVSYGGLSVPSGWLECNGTAYGRTGGDPGPQAALFTAIGTSWGPGDGSTTFNVPTLARRTLVGRNGAGTGTLGNVVGNIGGEEAHVQTSAEMANHGHTNSGTHDHSTTTLNGSVVADNVGPGGATFLLIAISATVGGATGSATSVNGANISINNNGSSAAANVIQPSAIVMMIIKT
jgi:microcystin-dependent protein